MKYFHIGFAIVIFIIGICVLTYSYKQDKQCRRDGGTYVRTFWGMECVYAH